MGASENNNLEGILLGEKNAPLVKSGAFYLFVYVFV